MFNECHDILLGLSTSCGSERDYDRWPEAPNIVEVGGTLRFEGKQGFWEFPIRSIRAYQYSEGGRALTALDGTRLRALEPGEWSCTLYSVPRRRADDAYLDYIVMRPCQPLP